MANNFLNYQISDLCLGKPPLNSLTLCTSTIADALFAIKASNDNFISIWSCTHHVISEMLRDNHYYVNANNHDYGEGLSCKCVGKLCMVDIICFLCKQENLGSVSSALLSPVSDILPESSGLVKHVNPSTSLVEAIDLILQGAQNLVVPIQTRTSKNPRRNHCLSLHNGHEYCWLTQEDVIQFILSQIGLFTPIVNLSVEALRIIRTGILTVDYHAPAIEAREAIAESLAKQTSVGVLDVNGFLVGEISPFTLCGCDETVVAAVMTLSSGDLMSFVDWGGPPEDILIIIREKLKEKKLEGLLEIFIDDYSVDSLTFSSSDDESSMSLSSSSSSLTKLTRHNRSWSYSARMMNKAEAIVCHPQSSLIAVTIQAIAHRVNYVWVMQTDDKLVGIVTFHDILQVFRDHIESMIKKLCA
ncbi:hypothetical protein vseg_007539 [Gypsophila vaccaria]